MKKFLIMLLMCVQVLAVFGGCFSSSAGDEKEIRLAASLNIVTSFGPDAGNYTAYGTAVQAWEKATGNTAENKYYIVDEISRRRILTDFETGSEPDVLYFFAGNDATPFVEAGMVVPLDEIKQNYPQYALNMAKEKLPVSMHDGKQYVVPAMGYWQGLYVNKKVLADAGVEMPDETTTWQEFLGMCEKIKQAGFVPVAMSLQNAPHYWFEYLLRNNSTDETFAVPEEGGDGAYQSWLAAIGDMKYLYERGYLPQNTFTSTNQEVLQTVLNGRAAFAIDGSWKIGAIARSDEEDNIAVTYVPAKDPAQTKEIIGGISMGYYITRKAWENPDKRQAAVEFVMHMTSNEVIASMTDGAVGTALKNESLLTIDNNFLQMDAFNMVVGAGKVLPAIQYNMVQNVRENFMTKNLGAVMTNEMTAKEALDKLLEDNLARSAF